MCKGRFLLTMTFFKEGFKKHNFYPHFADNGGGVGSRLMWISKREGEGGGGGRGSQHHGQKANADGRVRHVGWPVVD